MTEVKLVFWVHADDYLDELLCWSSEVISHLNEGTFDQLERYEVIVICWTRR